jgi:VWFA-related protein
MIMCFLFFYYTSAEAAENSVAATRSLAEPAAEINLSAIGYRGFAGMARLASQANLSLDFLDSTHVLVTFNAKKLLQRLPDCPPTHQDRLLHAAILELPSGKVVKQTDWYLHDNRRYLWSLGSGRFLLRKLNTLYVVDSSLQEKALLTSPKEFLWLTVTPDGKQIIAETADDAPRKKPKSDEAKAQQKVKIDFLDVATLAVQRTIRSEGIVTLEGTSSGFADVSHNISGKVWLIRFGPNSRQRENIARVRSRCIPDVFYSSASTLLIGRCSPSGPDYSVSAFTVTGHHLWHQHWNTTRYVPKIGHSDDGSRFAVSTLTRVQPPTTAAAADSDEETDDADYGLEQGIQVFDTASGTAVLSLKVSPVVLSAQNFSLSPDGTRLVVLNDSSLKLYDLPAMSEEDRAGSSAVNADVPGLYMASSGSEIQVAANQEDPAFGAVEAVPDSVDATQPREENKVPPVKADLSPAPKIQPVTNSDASLNKNADPSVVTFKSSSRIVVVDVVVTDQEGKPVTGLRAEDFRVAEDGKPQNISNFEAADSETPPAPAKAAPGAAPEAPPQLPPNVYTNNAPNKGKPAAESRSATLILLDLLNTPVPDQAYAREQLIKFLNGHPTGGPFALCTLSSNLRLIQGFTQEENLLIAAVNGKKGGVKSNPWQNDTGLAREIQFRKDLSLLDSNAQFTEQLLQQQQDEQVAHNADMRMRFTLDAFAQLSRYLSGIPGRKNVIWLSGAFPINIFPNPSLIEQTGVLRNYTADIKKATNLLAEAHIAVYPVSLKGAHTQPMFNASNNGTYQPPQVAGSLAPSGPGGAGNPALANRAASLAMPSRMDDETRQFREADSSEEASMDQVAADTGGKAFHSTNGIEDAIATAADQGAHYYSLSYSSNNRKYDGGFRKIKVALEQKGYHVAFRQGYYAVDPNAPIKETNDPARRIGVAAMQQGSPESHQIVFAVRVLPIGKPKKVDAAVAGLAATPPKKKNGPAGPVEMQHYGIDYAVDPAHLLFTETTAGLYHGVVDFMVTAFNDDGRLVASMASMAASDLRPANYQSVMAGGFRLHQELDVPVEAVALRLGVEDGTSNHIGTLEVPLPVPVPPEQPRAVVRSLPEIEPD